MLEQLESMRGLVSSLTHWVRPSIDVDDVLQEAAIAILGGYDRAPATKTYWTAQSARRSARRSSEVAREYFEESRGKVETESPLEALILREDIGRLRDAIDRLPVKYREVIELRYLEGMTVGQAASFLGISKSEVCKRTAKALGSLRRMMR